MSTLNNTESCCPRFDPGPWDDKEVKWENKKFVVDRVRSFFHIPLNFRSVMVRNMARIEAANAKPAEMVVLCDENSLWGADVYIGISQDVPNTQTVTLSGTFLSKVFEGPYKNVRIWAREMEDYLKAKGTEFSKLFFYYTTCPMCAKKYGKNYVVLLAQV